MVLARTMTAVLVLLCTLLSLAHAGEITPHFNIEKNSNQLLVAGHVSSSAHEAIIRQSARQYFGDADARFELRLLSSTPPGWALVTDLMLRAIAETQTSTTAISAEAVHVRGITANPEKYSIAIARVRQYLMPGMELREEIVVIRNTESFTRLCERIFLAALRSGTIEFEESSSTLSSGSYGQLDALVELATDCPTASISITGHTDSTGASLSNLLLSEARAQSVMAYLVTRGIQAERLSAHGAGSSAPVADNSDPRARHRNRRIEFELRFGDESVH